MRLPVSARALLVVTRYYRSYHNMALLNAYDIQNTTKITEMSFQGFMVLQSTPTVHASPSTCTSHVGSRMLTLSPALTLSAL